MHQVSNEVTYCPGKSRVLSDIWDIKRLHRVLDILSIHVIDFACIMFPAEKREVSSYYAVGKHAHTGLNKRAGEEPAAMEYRRIYILIWKCVRWLQLSHYSNLDRLIQQTPTQFGLSRRPFWGGGVTYQTSCASDISIRIHNSSTLGSWR